MNPPGNTAIPKEGTPAAPDEWPAEHLERVIACPVCEHKQREPLLEDLRDTVFFIAPGRWTMYRCVHCRSAYLNPRPDRASIGRAYASYYTHDAAVGLRGDRVELRGFRRIRRLLSNGYVNRRYGTRYLPESAIGTLMGFLFPRQRQSQDVEFRYLPKPLSGQRLLDLGCGNGGFLVSARDAGWTVTGLDPDPAAAAVARARGLDVRTGSLEVLDNASSCFDAITLSHVIEHMHAPRQALDSVHRLLRPGGVVYIDTPNIDSKGASEFGRNWRGLEPPRHLVLFTPDSLAALLQETGFIDIDMKRRPSVSFPMYLSSLRMSQGRSPYDAVPAVLPLPMRVRLALALTRTRRLEFITLTATRRGDLP